MTTALQSPQSLTSVEVIFQELLTSNTKLLKVNEKLVVSVLEQETTIANLKTHVDGLTTQLQFLTNSITELQLQRPTSNYSPRKKIKHNEDNIDTSAVPEIPNETDVMSPGNVSVAEHNRPLHVFSMGNIVENPILLSKNVSVQSQHHNLKPTNQLQQYNPYRIVNAPNMSVLELIEELLAHRLTFEVIGTKQAISMFNKNYEFWIKTQLDDSPEVKRFLSEAKPDKLEHQHRLVWKSKKQEVANIVYNKIARIVDSHRTKAKGSAITVNTLDGLRLGLLKNDVKLK